MIYLTPTEEKWMWRLVSVFADEWLVFSLIEDLCVAALTALGELVRGRAEDPCGPQLAAAAAEWGTDALAGHSPSLSYTHAHTLTHFILFYSISTHWVAGEETGAGYCRRWVFHAWFSDFLFFYSYFDDDGSDDDDDGWMRFFLVIVLSMTLRRMLQCLCQVGLF